MSDGAVIRRLTRFLYVLAASLFAGTILELLAAEHYDGPMQLVPFALSGLGLLAVGLLWRGPSRSVVLVIRCLMLVIAGGSLLGVYEHVTGNLAFVHEVRRNADTMTQLRGALQGADPILAPGVLAVGAIVTLAATWAASAHTAPARESANASETYRQPAAWHFDEGV